MSNSFRSASAKSPIVLLTGPRQVGKATLLQRLATKERRYVTRSDPNAVGQTTQVAVVAEVAEG
jgi:predicted AAA+ superfamily ATPase